MKYLLVLACLLSVANAEAAQIAVSHHQRGYAISVIGTINEGDEEEFSRLAEPLPRNERVAVLLTSPGGVLTGLPIGRLIRLRGFETIAVGNCASLCAALWLAGNKRWIAPSGTIGFHAAGQPCGSTTCVSSTGNALMGAYYAELGMSAAAIVLFTNEPPEKMAFVTPAQFDKLGISYTNLMVPSR